MTTSSKDQDPQRVSMLTYSLLLCPALGVVIGVVMDADLERRSP